MTTSTDTPAARPAPYVGRHRAPASGAEAARSTPELAWRLLMTCGRLEYSSESYAIDLARWRHEAWNLLMRVTPVKAGRRHAPESDAAIAATDELLAVRGEYLDHRTTGARIREDWDLAVIKFLGQLA